MKRWRARHLRHHLRDHFPPRNHRRRADLHRLRLLLRQVEEPRQDVCAVLRVMTRASATRKSAMAPCSQRRRTARRRDDSRAWFMHEASPVIFGPRQKRAMALWRVFARTYFEPRQKPAALNSGRLAHREGPSLRDLFAERDTERFPVKPIRQPIRQHTHLPDGRSADLRVRDGTHERRTFHGHDVPPGDGSGRSRSRSARASHRATPTPASPIGTATSRLPATPAPAAASPRASQADPASPAR